MKTEGYYKGMVKTWYLEKSRNGNYQIVLDVGLTEFSPDSPTGGMEVLEHKLRRKIFISLAKTMLTRAVADLKWLGYPATEKFDVLRLEPGHVYSIDFGVKPFVFECEHDSYIDKATDKPKDVERWTVCRRAASTPSREDADQINQMFEEANEKAP